MFLMILSVGVGGACGAILRYLTSTLVAVHFAQQGWLATLYVNLAGCFLMGVFAGFLGNGQAEGLLSSPQLRAMILVGFLGALTTFSSFALDFHHLLGRYSFSVAALYVMGSVIGSLAVFFIGYWFTQTAQTEL